MSAERWWVYRRPLLRDPLFILGLLLGSAVLVRTAVRAGEVGAVIFGVLFALPTGLLTVGIIGGSIREYRRARRGRAVASE